MRNLLKSYIMLTYNIRNCFRLCRITARRGFYYFPVARVQVATLSTQIIKPLPRYSQNVEIGQPISKDGVDESLEPDFNDVEPIETPLATFNFASHVNDSELLQRFVHLGVKLFKWERMQDVVEFILKLDFKRDIVPVLRFLIDNGVPQDNLAGFLTKNPYIFQQSIENLGKRVKYLESKKFTGDAISTILDKNPIWLNFSVEDIDRRLGLFQKTFKLTGSQVRLMTINMPKLVTEDWNQIKNINIKVKDEMGFEPSEIVKLLLQEGKIWTVEPKTLWRRFDLLHNDYHFTHDELVTHSKALSTGERRVFERISYLQQIQRAQFNPEKPNFVNLTKLVLVDDVKFVSEIAKSSMIAFNAYLKTL